MKLRTVALLAVASLVLLGLVGAGARAAFTTSTSSGQKITVGSFGGPPKVTITYPANNTTYGIDWAGAVKGTASALAGATIKTVKVSLQRVGGNCWTGSGDNYSAGCPNYVTVTTGTTNWALTLPNADLISGDSYKVTAQATDSTGNLGTSSIVTFSYDAAPPTVTITYPANGANVCACSYKGQITGSASSNSGTSITGASVAIKNTTTGEWWSGSSFSDSSETFVNASGTTSWTFPLAAKYFTTGDTYRVIAEATDSLGNVGTSSTVSLTYCLETPPTVKITYPVADTTYGSTTWTGTITGTAAAVTGATVKSVSVAIEDITTGKWWNGSSFGASSETSNKATGTTTWLLGLPARDLTSGNSYSDVAEATDNLGSVGTSSPVTFSYLVKTVPLTISITCPVNNTTYGRNWSDEITGTASAGTEASISKSAVAIEDMATSQWWNGSTFTGSGETWHTATGTTTWLLGLLASDLTSGVSYNVVAEATDNLGSTGTSSAVSFTYDTALPSVVITYPATATSYGTDWSGAITGTASSSAGGGTTVINASVAVENTTTDKWWNGTSFKSSKATFVAASGTTSWTFALPAGNLTSGDGYNVVAEATDSPGNIGTSATVSFSYNSTPPTVAITSPVTKATYGSTTWSETITDTAASNAGAGTAIIGDSVAIENTSTKHWWNGTSFSAKGQTFITATRTTSWTLTVATMFLAAHDSYSVVATATDSLGNLGTSPTVTFTHS